MVTISDVLGQAEHANTMGSTQSNDGAERKPFCWAMRERLGFVGAQA